MAMKMSIHMQSESKAQFFFFALFRQWPTWLHPCLISELLADVHTAGQ